MNPCEWRGGRWLKTYGLSPDQIEHRSLRQIGLFTAPGHTAAQQHIARRMAYAVGDPSLLSDICVSDDAVSAGLFALYRSSAIICDVRMVAAGINLSALAALGLQPRVAIDEPAVAAMAKASGLTRAAHAMAYLADCMEGAIVVIGNAPTALLSLLDLVEHGSPRPALVIGTPVGLVAASESKDALCQSALPYITTRGTRGGSPVAAAALNALLLLARQGGQP